MDAQEFIDRIKLVVRDSAISQVIEVLESPPGRKAAEETLARSRWYHSLDEDQKRVLTSVVLDAVDRTIFGLLCVIDGVRAIENGPEKGALELRYSNKNNCTMLNPPDGPMLHDLW